MSKYDLYQVPIKYGLQSKYTRNFWFDLIIGFIPVCLLMEATVCTFCSANYALAIIFFLFGLLLFIIECFELSFVLPRVYPKLFWFLKLNINYQSKRKVK